MADFGTDIGAITQQGFVVLSGADNLVAALLRRLITPRGGLFYDPTYGFDLRAYINEAFTDEVRFELETLVAAELEKDPRVFRANAVVLDTGLIPQGTINIRIDFETAQGPFRLILAADQVSVEVLRA